MEATVHPTRRRTPGWLAVATVAAAGAVSLAACSSSGSKTPVAAGGTTSTAGSVASPGTMFSTASVQGLGTVVVDGNGRTVYVLSADGHTNATCDDASGCTKVWPDLPFPTGTSAATAGTGLQASLLGTMKESDGQTYPTYHGWLMYEFSGDTAAGQGHGQGLQSFGGTWSALSPTGVPISTSSPSSTASSVNGY